MATVIPGVAWMSSTSNSKRKDNDIFRNQTFAILCRDTSFWTVAVKGWKLATLHGPGLLRWHRTPFAVSHHITNDTFLSCIIPTKYIPNQAESFDLDAIKQVPVPGFSYVDYAAVCLVRADNVLCSEDGCNLRHTYNPFSLLPAQILGQPVELNEIDVIFFIRHYCALEIGLLFENDEENRVDNSGKHVLQSSADVLNAGWTAGRDLTINSLPEFLFRNVSEN